MLKCKPIAASVTTRGRQMIEKTRDYVLNDFPKYVKDNNLIEGDLETDVIYGDSVTGDTPLILRDPETGNVTIKTIETLSEEWAPYENFRPWETKDVSEKQQAQTHYQVWSDDGWNDIKRVIRHKTNKKIFRVIADTGIVNVTEDHSLIDINNEKVKPQELKPDDFLLTSFPKIEKKTNNLTKTEAFKLGKRKEIDLNIISADIELKIEFLKGWNV